jgi:MFS transporter, DHA1 family, multidrug resistance protein
MRSQGQTNWRLLLLMFWITSFIEGAGVAQIYAFMPNRLHEVGMNTADIDRFVGLLGSLFFVSGLPFIPLWGVWADKYSRKAVIVRSALVEAVVFGAVAISQTPLQLVLAMLLVGFQLGNTGVMMAAIRDVTPGRRFGLAMGLFAASSPLGFGFGPSIGSFMIDQLHLTSGSVFGLSAAASVGIALMLAFGSRDVRPSIVPVGSTLSLAFGAVKGVLADPTVRWLFAIYGIVFLGRQMSTQYLSLLVHSIEGTTFAVSGSVGLVLGVATIIGASLSPIGGWFADRTGFRAVLVVSVAGLVGASLGMALAPSVAWLAVAYALVVALQAGVGAMVSGLLATELPVERRSVTLNLVFLPLYVGGIAGPALGSVVVQTGLRSVFFAAALILVGGVALAIAFARRAPTVVEEAPTPA